MSIDGVIQRIHGFATTRGEEMRSPDAIKSYLVMPLLSALGYDPFDPDQVVAGYQVEGSKVDFAALSPEGAPALLVTVSSSPQDLESPRARNLSAVLAEKGEVGLLTDGRSFRFHGLDGRRELVAEPFLSFDLSDGPVDGALLQALTRDGFDLEAAHVAGRLTKLHIVAFDTLLEQLEGRGEIHEAIARIVAPGGEATEASRAATAEAFAKAARILRGEEPAIVAEAPAEEEDEEEDSRRPLTGDEEAAYHVVAEIAARHIDPQLVNARPAQAYTAILFRDNNRKTICRLYFSASSTRYIGTFVGRSETKHRIQSYADVANFVEQIEGRLRELDPGAFDGRRPPRTPAAASVGQDGGGAEDVQEAPTPVSTEGGADAPAVVGGAPAHDESRLTTDAGGQDDLLGDQPWRSQE